MGIRTSDEMMLNGRFSYESVQRLATDHGERIVSSLDVDWNTLLVESRKKPATVDLWEPPPSSDLALILFTDGEIIFETREGRRASRRAVRPGQGRIIPSGAVERVRWFSDVSRNVSTTHIFIPKELFDACADEYRSAGSRSREIDHSISWFADPAINAVCRSLVDAVHDGAPGLYADTAALFLAKHLLSPHSGTDPLAEEENRSGPISDQRLARVMEYMQVNYARSLSIEDLSHEAGISKFHFVTVFRKKVGVTPHRYLTELRLNKAASLLQKSRSTIEQVARACGYGHAAQFTAAFTRYFDKTPSLFRKEGFRRASEEDGTPVV
jgi:AraC family transcriptional regulator